VVHGGLYDDRGSYAEYLKIDGDLAWRIPDSVTNEEASTYGVSAVTAMLGLLLTLGLPWPADTTQSSRLVKRNILIYSGATSASLFAIQLAKLTGLHVITTCSPSSVDYVKHYGADDVYDYNDPQALSRIISTYPDLGLAFDGFSAGVSTDFCCRSVAKIGGKVVSLDPMAKSKITGVDLVPILMYTLFGKPFALLQPIGPSFPAKPEDRAGLVKFYQILPSLISGGLLRSPPTRVLGEGLVYLEQGLDMLRTGRVSREKIVVKLQR
jgi:NADPH:quinone reductase-like Zn-dependent oxidoreductase